MSKNTTVVHLFSKNQGLQAVSMTYSDDFDENHYPISDSDLLIVRFLSFFSEWAYCATIHGKIFTAVCPATFDLNSIKKLAESARLRWVSINEFRIDADEFKTACGIGFLNGINLEVTEFSIGLKHDNEI